YGTKEISKRRYKEAKDRCKFFPGVTTIRCYSIPGT
ncbi:hypothetical protein A2U01_0070964, partial [Trifolium medium]|nr:hypothetical protein [Trifolium medium]